METTKENFTYFIKECEHWIEKFHLREWEFRFRHKDHKNSLAWYKYGWEGRLVTIGLSIKWDEIETTKYNLSKSAFHEVCEILLANLESTARLDICPSQEQELTASKHSIIRRMEWAIWEPYFEKNN